MEAIHSLPSISDYFSVRKVSNPTIKMKEIKYPDELLRKAEKGKN